MIIGQRILDKARTAVTTLALLTSLISLWLVYTIHLHDNELGSHSPSDNRRLLSETGRGTNGRGAGGRDEGGRDELETRLQLLKKSERPADFAFNFNVSISDNISLDRKLPDTRPEACKDRIYNVGDLPPVSVIIPFYNEAWSTLLRTVHSIVNRTPSVLLKEIILVDDSSTYEYLGVLLENYMSKYNSKIKLLRNARREGLIRSRMNGFRASSAEVIVFLDAHTEVNIMWYEPLAARLKLSPKCVLQSFIDGIDHRSMVYAKPSDIHKGAFTWDLRYVWIKVPDYVQKSVMDHGASFTSITLVGCVISVKREYFELLGGLDTGMKVWGGENIELSFRTWMCGGTVETISCSRIGHLFRTIPYREDITVNQVWQKNLMRIADVWMGEYKKYFYSSTMVYAVKRVTFSPEDVASLKSRVELKARLGCRSFEWFMSQVAVDIPRPARDALYHGEITNLRTKGCWSVKKDGYIDINQICYEHKLMTENEFTMTSGGLLLYRERCVFHDYPSPNLRVADCPTTVAQIRLAGIWSMRYVDSRWGEMRLMRPDRPRPYCVQHATSVVEPHRGQQMAQTSHCSDPQEQDDFQLWSFTYRFDYNATIYFTK